MADLVNRREYELKLDAFIDRVDDRLWPIFVRKIAFDLLKLIVLGTPVDTGRARGNWIVEIGEPRVEEVDRLDPSGGATIQLGSSVIGSTSGKDLIYYANNLPYIEALEMGHSKQAPAGIVGVAIATIQQALRA